MVLISHRYKFIYVMCEKVASTSVEAFFDRYCLPEDQEATYVPTCASKMVVTSAGLRGARPDEIAVSGKKRAPVTSVPMLTMGPPVPLDEAEVKLRATLGLAPNQVVHPHTPIGTIRYMVTPEQFNTYYKFCVVRNPWDVQVSMFTFIRTITDRKITFQQYLKSVCVKNSDLYMINGKPALNFYIRYENLENDIKSVCNTLNLTYDISTLPKYRTDTRLSRTYREYYTPELRDIVANQCADEIRLFGYTF